MPIAFDVTEVCYHLQIYTLTFKTVQFAYQFDFAFIRYRANKKKDGTYHFCLLENKRGKKKLSFLSNLFFLTFALGFFAGKNGKFFTM